MPARQHLRGGLIDYIVIGGGLSGLMAARRLRLTDPLARITVVERAPVFGGLLAGRSYESSGLYFDMGTHISQETGNLEIDQFLQDAIGAENLILFPPGQGDLAGLVFNRKLQSDSHFPDLRGFPDGDQLIGKLRDHIGKSMSVPEIDRTASLMHVAESRFGVDYSRLVLAPILEHAYGITADQLSGFAMLLPGLSRVNIDDENGWLHNQESARYRAIVGYPDQTRLPVKYRHGRRSFYARRNGSRAVIDGVVRWLVEADVQMLYSTNIIAFDVSVPRVTLQGPTGEVTELYADGLVFSNGPIGAAQVLGLSLEKFGFERPMPHWIVNMQLKMPTTTNLCFAYGMDIACDWYRVTNYRGFSGDQFDRRITLEVLGDRVTDQAEIVKALAGQLKASGLIEKAEWDFADVFRLPAGFPLPTTQNLRAMMDLADELKALLPSNMILGGIGSRQGLFFQNEVVSDIYERVGALT